MRVLVTAASRHGSTGEIGESIAGVLSRAGLAVETQRPDDVRTVEGFDAVILGSGVYVGRWLPEAARFAQSHAGELRQRPAWLFSSGPIGAPEVKPTGDPVGVDELLAEINARAHRVFPGRVDRRRLSIGEKIVLKAVRAPDGDFRDWPAVESWACGIASQLLRRPTGAGASA